MTRLTRPIGLLVAALSFATALRAVEEPVPTVIASDTAEMVSTDAESTFTFKNNVVVTGTNLKITCDELVVVAHRHPDPKATIGKQDRFKSLVAMGHVHILQSDREATCERAEVFPSEDKVVLTGNPVVQSTDGAYRADGPRLVLYKGQRRAVIEGGPTERTHITLPTIKDLGYDKDSAKPASPSGTGTTSTAPQK